MSAHKSNSPGILPGLEPMLASASQTLPGNAVDAGDLLSRLQLVANLLAGTLAKPTEPALLFQPTDQAVQVKPIGSSLVVGRASASTLSFPEIPKLSRSHFEIRRDGNRFILHDPGSHNGTTIVGRPGRIDRHELRDGDIIHAGGLVFVFVGAGRV